jgi:hypothetical protein
VVPLNQGNIKARSDGNRAGRESATPKKSSNRLLGFDPVASLLFYTDAAGPYCEPLLGGKYKLMINPPMFNCRFGRWPVLFSCS